MPCIWTPPATKARGGTFLCLDGFTGWVLLASKIASENESELRPAVERTVAAFGDPLASVRDLGSGGAKAVAGLRQRGIPDLLCHYHFLAAVGKRLLDEDHAKLRGQLTRSRLRSRLRDLLAASRGPAAGLRQDLPALLLWLLEGTGHKHPSYPFALPHLDFYRRCQQFPAERDRRLPAPRSPREQRLLRQVAAALADWHWLQRPDPTAQRLQRRWDLFCELREVLRFSSQDLPHGQPPQRPPPAGPGRQRAPAADAGRRPPALSATTPPAPPNPRQRRTARPPLRPSCWTICSAMAQACAAIR